MVRPLVAVIVLRCACVGSDATRCEDGRVCPSGTTCTAQFCVTSSQRQACGGLDDLAACVLDDDIAGLCRDGACIAIRCGDGLVTGDEECDGRDLGGALDCSSIGYHDAAPLSCTPLCTYEVAACTRRCGDGVVDPEEECDADPGAIVAACTDARFGFYEAAGVTCSSACIYDLTSCQRRCGDGVLDPEEQCDGAPPAGSCLDYGYDAGRLGCSAFCGPSFERCERIGWYRAVPPGLGEFARSIWSPKPGDLWVGTGLGATHVAGGQATSQFNGLGGGYGIWGVDGDAVYTVGGYSGGVARYSGGTWTTVWPQSSTELWGVAGTGSNDIWVVGSAGTILHYDGVWSPSSVASGTLHGVWANAPDHAVAVGAGASSGGAVFRYDGASWNADTVPSVPALEAVWGSGPDDVWAVGGNTILHRDAQGWTIVGTLGFGFLYGVWGRAPDDVYVVGNSGTMLRYDGDHWWQLQHPAPSAQFYGVGGNAEQTFAAALDDLVVRNDGASWSLTTGAFDHVGVGGDGSVVAARGGGVSMRGPLVWNDLAAPAGIRRLWVGSAALVIGVVPSGGVHLYDGISWTALAGAPTASAVWATAANDVWTAGGETLGHWNGISWTATSVSGAQFHSVAGTPGGDVYAVGTAIRRFDGSQWSPMARPGTAILRDVWAASAGDVWAVGDSGTVLHFDGVTWTAVPSPTTAQLTAVHGSAADDVWAVGTGGTLLRYDGIGWTRVRGVDDGRYVDVAVRDDLVLVVRDTGGDASLSGLVTLVRSPD